jgi:hypothetical protein
VGTVLVSLLTLVFGAVVSGVLTYLGARRKLALDYDADLRTRRIVAYAELWSRLEPLAKYARRQFFSAVEAKELAESLRSWYFQTGGLYLSELTRHDYFALQELLTHLDGDWGWESPDRESLTLAAREHLRTYGSRLRTSLAQDVGTRTRPQLRTYTEPFDYALAGVYQRDDGQQLELGFRRRRLGRSPRVTLGSVEGGGVRPIDVVDWSPSRMTIRAVLDDPEGNQRERVLLIEGGQLVEGPPLDEKAPARPALWRPTETGG